MPDNIHLCLSDLLDQDVSSNEFFNTLSPNVQKRLLQKDIRSFEELQKCAKAYKKNDWENQPDDLFDEYNSACSAGDCTGLIPTGSNLSNDEFDSYKDIYPFSNPPFIGPQK